MGRVTSVRYRSIDSGGFILLFFSDASDNAGKKFRYKSSVLLGSCYGDCQYFLPDDLEISSDGDTFYGLYYYRYQVVGNSDFTLASSTRAYLHPTSSSYYVHELHSAYKNGLISNVIDLGRQALPGIVIYIADFQYG